MSNSSQLNRLDTLEQIAIDGPAASGKSTVARQLAAAIGGTYINTGEMYRALTWLALQAGLNPRVDIDAIIALTTTHNIDFDGTDSAGTAVLTIDSQAHPESVLRTPEVTANVSYVARIPKVREWLVKRQRHARKMGLIVVEGRDIGSVVFPNARFKFFITASPEERARRRLEQDGETPDGATIASVAATIAERDHLDSTRSVAPLKPTADAVIIDTTALSIADVVEQLRRQVASEISDDKHGQDND